MDQVPFSYVLDAKLVPEVNRGRQSTSVRPIPESLGEPRRRGKNFIGSVAAVRASICAKAKWLKSIKRLALAVKEAQSKRPAEPLGSGACGEIAVDSLHVHFYVADRLGDVEEEESSSLVSDSCKVSNKAVWSPGCRGRGSSPRASHESS